MAREMHYPKVEALRQAMVAYREKYGSGILKTCIGSTMRSAWPEMGGGQRFCLFNPG